MTKIKKFPGIAILFVCILFPFQAFAQVQPVMDYTLESMISVRTDQGESRMNEEVVTMNIEHEGYYRIFPHMWYDSGDDQPNETYYLTVVNEDGTVSTPSDSNAGPYKVVPDIPGTPHHVKGQPVDTLNTVFWRDSGLFYLKSGQNTIWLHHYAMIADLYPQFVVGDSINLVNVESIRIHDSLRVVAEPLIDGTLTIDAFPPRFEMVNSEEHGVLYPTEIVDYKITIRNESENEMRFARIVNTIPDSLDPTAFSVKPLEIDNRRIFWSVPDLSPADSFIIFYQCSVPLTMPDGFTPLMNAATLIDSNDTDLSNNQDSVLVYVNSDLTGAPADLVLSLVSNPDTLVVAGPDTVYYDLVVTNNGPGIAENVIVQNELSDLISFQSSDPALIEITGNTIIWNAGSLAPLDSTKIKIVASLKDPVAETDSLVITTGSVFADNDTSLANNTVTDTVFIFHPPIVINSDVAIEFVAKTDTFHIVSGDTLPAVLPGEDINYELIVSNLGPDQAKETQITLILPDSINIESFSIEPDSQIADTLIWNLDSLIVGQPFEVQFVASPVDSFTSYPYPLPVGASVVTENDPTEDNNQAETIVHVLEPPQQTDSDNIDLELTFDAKTDTFYVLEGDTLPAVLPGEDIHYELVVSNLGPDPAEQTQIILIVPDSLNFDNFNFEPDSQNGDTLIWNLEFLDAGDSFVVQIVAAPVDSFTTYPFPLESDARVISEQDTTADNNQAETIVYVLEPLQQQPQPENVDLAIEFDAKTDTFYVIEGDTLPAVLPGEDIHYELVVSNLGPNPAEQTQITLIVPDSVNFDSFNFEPDAQNGDTLIWNLEFLDVGESFEVQIVASPVDSFATYPFPLQSDARVISEQDTTADNNEATTIVYVLEPQAEPDIFDLALTLEEDTDHVYIVASDTADAAYEDELYSYTLNVTNDGPGTATEFSIWFVKPDSVDIVHTSLEATSPAGADTLVWNIASLSPNTSIDIILNAKAIGPFEVLPFELQGSASVNADLDSNSDNDYAESLVYVIKRPESPHVNTDLAIEVLATTDTTTQIDGQTEKAVLGGENYNYTVTVTNNGPVSAYDIGVTHIQPDSVKLIDLSMSPIGMDLDSTFWLIDSLPVGEEWSVNFQVMVSDSLPFYPFPLQNNSYIIALQDTTPDNNNATDMVYALAARDTTVIEEDVDLIVVQKAITDSFAISENDSLKYVREGETYTYIIDVTNNGQTDALNVIVRNIFDATLDIPDITPQATRVEGDTIFWNLVSIPALTTVRFQFDATVPDLMPIGTNQLINVVSVSAENENPENTDNNSSVLPVYNIIRQPAPFTPLIDVNPPVADVSDSVQVRIQVPVPVNDWEIWVIWPNGDIDKEFFHNIFPLEPGVWYDLDEWYKYPNLVTPEDQEDVVFEFHARSERGVEGVAEDRVTFRDSEDMILDRNVYRIDAEDPIEINFRLNQAGPIEMNVYDVAGRFITKLTDDYFTNGWSTYYWNGQLDSGRKIGSGVYLVTLKADNLKMWKKLIIVR